MNKGVIGREYEAFFRNGGYRLMRLMATKALLEPSADGRLMDVNSLVRLQYGYDAGDEYAARMKYRKLRTFTIWTERFICCFWTCRETGRR